MRSSRIFAFAFFSASIFLLTGLPAGWSSEANAQTAETEAPDNEICLDCHGIEGFDAETPNGGTRQIHVSPDRFKESVHGKRFCVECHKDILEIPHEEFVERKVSCVQCHRKLWDDAQREGKTEEFARLGEVVEQINSYMGSVHAQPNAEDQSHTNATCYNCHNAHYILPIEGKVGAMSRLEIPEICGKCHEQEAETYSRSVHGEEIKVNANPYAAVCIDCHTTHNIASPEADSIKLAITRNCGNCHEQQYETYVGTYHGQVNTLGYAYTAKCFDCHGSHGVKRVDDESSMIHANNRLATCSKCHDNVTGGFATFQPHGNTRDFDRYPFMWIAAKFMTALLGGVFAFFWTHAALWFYREYKDRKEGKNTLHVQTNQLSLSDGKYVRRWSLALRIAHLLLALVVMTLVLTGTAVLYAECSWAQLVMYLLGGPENAAFLHRIAALTFITLFAGHLLSFFIYLIRNWKEFKFFGPNSLVPNLQDLRDVVAMFKWFFGKGPRPIFDRWAYWEKFDYWAPFWGMGIIGISGLMMWFPGATASVLPGWVFNVATIVHGEEAFLAAVFLFSVHFFNVHFRPDKFPQDIVMFTGVMPLEEFKHEHTLEYQRMVENGELEKYLVEAPSAPMTLFSKILGATLIFIGLALLVLVLNGFSGHTGV
ncbi:MAG: cytochrome C [Alphaproteobacteria bacterium]|nr:cytochrome C [Alphaproteobacteria bacterium]